MFLEKLLFAQLVNTLHILTQPVGTFTMSQNPTLSQLSPVNTLTFSVRST
jgi:hypothetical protein